MRDRRWLLSFGLALGAVLVAPSPGSAGVLDASWTAPTTNTDGSPLIDLASYRVYYGASAPPCPGGTFVQVPSSTSTPSVNQTVRFGQATPVEGPATARRRAPVRGDPIRTSACAMARRGS